MGNKIIFEKGLKEDVDDDLGLLGTPLEIPIRIVHIEDDNTFVLEAQDRDAMGELRWVEYDIDSDILVQWLGEVCWMHSEKKEINKPYKLSTFEEFPKREN